MATDNISVAIRSDCFFNTYSSSSHACELDVWVTVAEGTRITKGLPEVVVVRDCGVRCRLFDLRADGLFEE